MASRHGGTWTEQKLDVVEKYLRGYLTIMLENPTAKTHFRTVYLDAFAGSGMRYARRPEQTTGLFEEFQAQEIQEFIPGSAMRAMSLPRRFDEYVFVDKSRDAIEELRALTRDRFPDLKVRLEVCDANEFIPRWVSQLDAFDRAVVFLDPYGAQVDWTTVEALGKHRGVDLWLLFPLGQAVIRMLGKEGPRAEWSGKLDRLYGTHDWHDYVYTRETKPTLFGDEEVIHRDAGVERLAQFTIDRLRTVFGDQVLETPAYLHNSKGVCLYILCFAATNPKGWVPARRIAAHLVRDLSHG